MNLAVVGSRSYKDNLLAKKEAISLICGAVLCYNIDKIVSGGAVGPDKWAEEAASEMKVEQVIYKPDWKTYGKSAGFRRNHDIINDADYVLIFWDGKSKGTSHDIMLARKYDKAYELFVWQKSGEWSKLEGKSA
jgi:uncharacterized phage-like protein YoqJ